MCSSRSSFTATPVERIVRHSSSASSPSVSGSLRTNSGSSTTGHRIESATESATAPAQAGTAHQSAESRWQASNPAATAPPSTRPISRALAWSASQPAAVWRERPFRRESTYPA